MEISAFSPYSDDYLSAVPSSSNNLFSFFQEFDSISVPTLNHSTTTSPPPIKRKRLDNEPNYLTTTTTDFDTSTSNSPFQDILNTFWNFETEKLQQQEEEFVGFPSLVSSYSQSSTPSPMRNIQPEMMKQEVSTSAAAAAPEPKRARRGSPDSEGTEAAGGSSSVRRLWVKNRSNAWWEQCNSPDFPDEEFKKAFRMSKATFDMICDELESVVTKKDTMLRLAIPVRQRVAVCIWRLATGEPLREVSKRFGLGISTCHKLVLEVCAAIRNVLMPKFLQWPNDEKMREIKRGFEGISGINDVGGAIYTTHVPIIAPKQSVASYFNKRHTERNQKTSYSITVQGVVDPRGIFTDICVGWPGSMTDDKVLEQSALYQRANRGLMRDVWMVGNSGFPLMDWLLVPYTKQNVTWTQHALNEKVGAVQGIVKEAFMRLKARWSCLQKRTEVKLQDLPIVLGACCVLHNICEMRGEELSPDLRFDLFDDEVVPENPVRSMNAAQARDQLAHKLLHHNLAGTTFL
ncbi:OLC1v1037782C1 [Oldenlandia corymbosa var. corymbosa]|uniref:OLC1v1037782C1 n=1 Tax=Oldenlandia corymbosa var. corymbosa TaxID=529605 RepID=A0AAV1CY75_OLDCO|nr:OLC1v1037782C1 [Oldenlandia corymbosa var. corymbosa]